MKTVVTEYSLAPYQEHYLLALEKTIYLTNLVQVKSIEENYQLSPLVSNKIKLLKKGNQTYLTTQGKLDRGEQQQFNELNMYLDEYVPVGKKIPLF